MKLTRFNELVEEAKTRKGKWRVGRGNEIEYRSLNEELLLRGSWVAAEADALVFSAAEKRRGGKTASNLLKLSGSWSADDKNRLVFSAEKENGRNDVLTFSGTWKIDGSQEIVYVHETSRLKTKKKESRGIRFEGHWDVTGKNRLVYRLSAGSDSAFTFRGAFQTPSILAKKGELRYQLGSEIRSAKSDRTIVLFGKWKASDRAGLSFEIEYGKRRKKAIAFGGEYSFDGGKTVSAALRSSAGQPLGLELIFTQDFLRRDGQAFLRGLLSRNESRLEAGASLRW